MSTNYTTPRLAAILLLLMLSAIAAQANGVVALVNASILFETQENYSEALKQMEAAYELAKDDYQINLRLGWVYYLNNNFNLSEKHYRRALTLSENKSIEALYGLVLPLSKQNEWTKVESSYQRILELDPENYEATLRLGQLYSNQEDSGRAKVYFERLLQYYPGSYETNLSAGWNYEALGDKQSASECFRRALMYSPSDSSATRGLELVK